MKSAMLSKSFTDKLARGLPILLVIGIALAVRLYVFTHTAVINPDGPLYIYQARSLFITDWHALTKCGLPFLSIYPFLISFVHLFIKDWVAAAQMVSLFFGTALLVPAYLLLREYFDKQVSLCATFAFSMIPIMVGRSVDVVRDPISWFFLTCGLLFVVLAFRKGRPALLTLAAIVFSLAMWARIEAIVYLVITAIVLLTISGPGRWRNLLWFCGPFLLLAGIIFWSRMGNGGGDLYRFREMQARVDAFSGYSRLRNEIANIAMDYPYFSMPRFFLLESKRFAWLIAAASVANRFFEAISYGFAAVFIVGLRQFRSRFADDRFRLYFPVLCGASFILLYAFMLQTWIMEYRYTVSIMLGGLVIFGVGVEQLMLWLRHFLKAPRNVLAAAMGVLFFFSVLPKNIQARAETEVAFKMIGEVIAAQKNANEPVKVVTSQQHIRLVSFFANLDSNPPQCPELQGCLYDDLPARHFQDFVNYLRENKIEYFLWEEKNWPATYFSVTKDIDNTLLTELGRWTNKQAGQMVLYRLR